MIRSLDDPVAPVAAHERVESIDALRGLALFGVLQINLVTEFRVSLFTQFETRHTHSGLLDRLVDDFLSVAVNSKAFALFSFLFGVGLAVQYERAARADRAFLPFALRRLTALLAIGLIHLLFVWNGDILTSYALVGIVAAPFARCSQRTLLVLGGLALAVYVAPVPYPDMFGADESMHEHIERALLVYGHGSFADVARFRLQEIRHIAPLLLGSLPRTFALYLLGIAAWRARLFDVASRRGTTHRWVTLTGILVGGGTQVAMFGGAEGWWTIGDRAGSVIDGLGQIALAFGYAAAVVLLARNASWSRLLRPFAALGRAALTNYLMESIVFGLLFYGYGASLFGRLSPAEAAGLGVAVYGLQVVASVAWFKRFRFGPVEWAWRSVTYGAPQPMAKER